MNALKYLFHQIKNVALDTLFPPRCFGCNADCNNFLCAKCAADIPIYNAPFCPLCHNRLPEDIKHCHPDAPYKLAAVTEYRHPVIKQLIHELKYRYLISALVPIEDILRRYCATATLHTKNFIVVPVPLHRARLRERGFNQAALIARIVARCWKLTIYENALTRTRNTRQQSAARGGEARAANVAGCFVVKNPTLVTGKKIILVDDVYTSGATVSDAVRALKAASARQIVVFVLARAR